MPKCPKCESEMYINTVIVLGGKNKHYLKCESCDYRSEAK